MVTILDFTQVCVCGKRHGGTKTEIEEEIGFNPYAVQSNPFVLKREVT